MASTIQLFLCSIVVVFCVIDYSVGDSYCITPFANASRHESCSTLSEFAQNVSSITVRENDTMILDMQPGNHILNVNLSLFEVNGFSMESVSRNPLDTTIVCAYSVSFEFDSVVNVQLIGLTLNGCTENRVFSVEIFKLQHCVFLTRDDISFQQSLGAALIVNKSEVEILNTSFSSFAGSQWTLQRVKANRYINMTYSNVGGAIISSESKITIENSTFSNNSAQIGGVFFAELESKLIIINCNFTNNTITCQQLFCYGGVLFLDSSKVLVIKRSRFITNENTHFDHHKITRGGAIAAFYCIYARIYDSMFNDNLATFGGALFLRDSPNLKIFTTKFTNNRALSYGGVAYTKTCKVKFVNATFVGNTALKVGGVFWMEDLTINISYSCFHENAAQIGGAMKLIGKTNLEVYESNFTGNRAKSSGGVIFVSRSDATFSECLFKQNFALSGSVANVVHGSMHLRKNNVFEGNQAQVGTIGLYHSTAGISGELNLTNNSGSVFLVDSKFQVTSYCRNCMIIIANNRPFFSHTGNGGTNHEIEEGGGITSIMSEVKLYGKLILSENRATNGGGILAVSSKILISGRTGSICNNEATNTGGGIYLYQTMLSVEGSLTIANNTAADGGGGLHSVSSFIILRLTYFKKNQKPVARLKFLSNSAIKGGGVFLEVNSKFYIASALNTISIQFINNTAQYGGAIYVNDETNNGTCTSSQKTVTAASESECFFQSISVITDTRPLVLERNVLFLNNHADISGGSLYGGLLDRCTINVFDNLTTFSRVRYANQPDFVKDIVNSTASKAVRVCFCRTDEIQDCDYQPETIHVMKGQHFTLSLVAVDHVNNSVSTKIRSYLSDKGSRLGNGQKLQNASSKCTELNFRVYTKLDNELLTLYAKGPCRDAGISRRQIAIKIMQCMCAVGFQPLLTDSTKCKCVCDTEIQKYVSNCNPLTNLIQRNSDAWIAPINNNTYFAHPHCPFDYCHPPSDMVDINLSSSDGADAQCAYNRSGILCSHCQPDLTLSLGSSRCISCSKYWPALFTVTTIGACIAGVALVFLMLALNLTVATGTLNGIIFYANILAANKTIILPFPRPNFITVILAWLNLDVGFELCYFKGMDSYAKAWIELCFPVYVILLVTVVILVCKYSTKFSSLIGRRNPVSTLATLILLSYAKLLQSTISAMSYAVLKYPDGSHEVVWRPDATVRYIKGKHAALFFVALVLLVLGVAYTALLLSWQWLLPLSNMYLFKWVKNTKLSSFMDAYHAPYTPKRRYWTGLLLLARAVVYLVSAVNFSGEPSINLLAIGLVVTSLFILKYNVYKVWLIDVIETGLYINLIMFSVGKLYLQQSKNYHTVIAYISTAMATIMLACILLHHVVINLPFPLKSWIQQALKKTKKARVRNNDLTNPFLDDADDSLLNLATSTREEETH